MKNVPRFIWGILVALVLFAIFFFAQPLRAETQVVLATDGTCFEVQHSIMGELQDIGFTKVAPALLYGTVVRTNECADKSSSYYYLSNIWGEQEMCVLPISLKPQGFVFGARLPCTKFQARRPSRD